MQFASNDWILSLDADERLDEDAVAAIEALAWARYERGTRPSKSAPALPALVAQLRKRIFKGGLCQGMDGVTVAVTTAFHAYMKYLKLNELHEQKKREESA